MVRYDQPHQFEPLLPTQKLDELTQATRRVLETSAALKYSARPHVLRLLGGIVRSMNSYYSNRIEGQATHPLNIEEALSSDFSHKPDIAQRQRIALAHIDAEIRLEQQTVSEAQVLSSTFLRESHASLYRTLPMEDRVTEDGRIIVPGALRTHDVRVGQHVPPAFASLPRFFEHMDRRYGSLAGMDALLYTIAAAHHRMAWTHPFEDGNGRAVRLQTHCALHRVSGGLWSVNRGLARDRDRYYGMLEAADAPRRGDLDGRGNLSEQMLWQWCHYFIEICDDQVQFMTRMLDMSRFDDRLREYILRKNITAVHKEYREEAVLPMQVLAAKGTLSRGDFIRMTGLGERTARKVVSRFIADGLILSDGPKASLALGLPMASLGTLLPNLYPEIDAPNDY